MRQPPMRKYPAALKERAVQLAVESEQPMAPPARDLGVHANTLQTWIGNDHRPERQEKVGQDAQLSEERKRLRKAKTRFQEARAIVKKAAASCAPQLPCRTPASTSSPPRCACVACAHGSGARAAVITRGGSARSAPRLLPRRSDRPKGRTLVRRGVGPRGRVVSSIWWRRRGDGAAGVAWGACCPTQGCAATRGVGAKPLAPQGQPRRGPQPSSPGRLPSKTPLPSMSGIAPTFRQAKAGGLSLSCWSCARVPWWGGLWLTPCGPRGCTRRWRWPLSAATRRGAHHADGPWPAVWRGQRSAPADPARDRAP